MEFVPLQYLMVLVENTVHQAVDLVALVMMFAVVVAMEVSSDHWVQPAHHTYSVSLDEQGYQAVMVADSQADHKADVMMIHLASVADLAAEPVL